jgi:hypothetical protein
MVMANAFTPGDWTANGFQIVALHSDEDGKHETVIADIHDQHDWARANARLIRAAPDLLIALQFLVIRGEGEAAEAGVTETPWLNEARAAIAYATRSRAAKVAVTIARQGRIVRGTR